MNKTILSVLALVSLVGSQNVFGMQKYLHPHQHARQQQELQMTRIESLVGSMMVIDNLKGLEEAVNEASNIANQIIDQTTRKKALGLIAAQQQETLTEIKRREQSILRIKQAEKEYSLNKIITDIENAPNMATVDRKTKEAQGIISQFDAKLQPSLIVRVASAQTVAKRRFKAAIDEAAKN